jgi:hypothetical protein
MNKKLKMALWIGGGAAVAYFLYTRFWPAASPTATRQYGSTGTPTSLLPAAVQFNPSGYVVAGNTIRGTGPRIAQQWKWNGASWVWTPVITASATSTSAVK